MSSSTNSAPASQQQAPHVPAPPPAGYPTMRDDSSEFPRSGGRVETKSKGDGFWKGCCAALCCCLLWVKSRTVVRWMLVE
ncbi:hypothetical protein M0R45_032629 [Rubus argutus]|uniref:Cysteine-rich transmembrane domain-containing protein n=1 Tax=Rubus argutus TaxID=59490 RepID=A0AAW1WHE3_RUBAR